MIDREKYLLEDEFAKLLPAAKKLGKIPYMLVLLGGNLGLRVGELVGLRKADYLGEGLLRIRTLKQRGAKTHEIVVDPKTEEALRGYLRGVKDHLFPGRVDGHASTRWAQLLFHRICKAAGLERDYSIHSLRHYRGIALWETSKDLFFTKSQLRHARVSSTEVYMHMSPSKLEEMRARLGKLAKV